MRLKELEQSVYDALGHNEAPDPAVVRRVRRGLSLQHRRILSLPGMQRLREDVYALTSTAGTAEYALPPAIAQIRGIHQRTNTVALVERSLDWLRAADPGLTNSGGPAECFIPMGIRAVAAQPSNASDIFVKSTSASDVGMAFLEAVRTGGYQSGLTVTMTGTTAVSFSGSVLTDILQIDKFTLDAAAIGTVTLHEDSGAGTELARIPIGSRQSRYQWIRLWPTPSGETYHIDYIREVSGLTQPSDEPLLPLDFHDILVDAVVEEEATRSEHLVLAGLHGTRMRTRLNELKHWLFNPPTYRPVVGGGGDQGSNLGAWYPAGRW